MMICYKENQHPIDMVKKDEESFRNSTHCNICQKPLD